jgi:dihydrofolate reductase
MTKSDNGFMGNVFLDMSMSLDGFIAGPNITTKQPMGKGGLRLHDWIFGGKTDVDTQIMEEMETSGAVIVGGRTYHIAIDDAWGGANPFKMPAFVLTKDVPENVVKGFTFVTDGIESALRQAKAVAGDKNVLIMGGANIAQQYVQAGLLDEIRIHLVPVLLGEGTRLFDHIGTEQIELERTRVIESPSVTHFKFRVVK